MATTPSELITFDGPPAYAAIPGTELLYAVNTSGNEGLLTDQALPSPGDRFLEIETAKLHGGWPAWRGLPTVAKAELLAHELHKRMREHYGFDQRTEGGGRPADKKPKGDFLSRMRDRFLGGGENKYA